MRAIRAGYRLSKELPASQPLPDRRASSQLAHETALDRVMDKMHQPLSDPPRRGV
jgi:hypothetical protein